MEKFCIIAVDPSQGIWGRGQTIDEATKKFKQEGGKMRGEKVGFILVVGDDTAEVDDGGCLVREPNSWSKRI